MAIGGMIGGGIFSVLGVTVAFAVAGQAALGQAGYWLATLGALLATSSAIKATLFSTRQMHEIAQAKELTAVFGKSRNGLPVIALLILTVFGAAFAMVPDIAALLTFGSAVFLTAFGTTNLVVLRVTSGTLGRTVSGVAALACLSALVVLLVQLLVNDRAALLLIAACRRRRRRLAAALLLRLAPRALEGVIGRPRLDQSCPWCSVPAGCGRSTCTSRARASLPSNCVPKRAKASLFPCAVSASGLVHFSIMTSRSSPSCRAYNSQPASSAWTRAMVDSTAAMTSARCVGSG